MSVTSLLLVKIFQQAWISMYSFITNFVSFALVRNIFQVIQYFFYGFNTYFLGLEVVRNFKK